MIEPARLDIRRDGAAIILLVATALVIQLPLYHRWFSLLDEAAILQIADELNAGRILYRDAVHVAFPGIFYLTAALFRLFGPSIVVGRVLMMVLFTAVVILVYLLARTVAGRVAAFTVGLLTVAYRITAFPHWQMLSYTSVAVFLLMVAVAIAAIGVRGSHRGWPIAAGAFCGIAAVFKQDCSALLAAGLACFYFVDGFATRPLRASVAASLRFGLTAAVPPVLAILAFAPAGLLGEMLWQTIWFPLVKQPVWAPGMEGSVQYIGFPPMWPPFAKSEVIRWDGYFSYFPSIILDFAYLDILRSRIFQDTILPELFVRLVYGLPYAVLAFAIAAVAITARRSRSSERVPTSVRHLRLLLFAGVMMMASFNRPRDLVHLMILYLPTLILLAYVIDTVAVRRWPWWRRLVLGSFASVVVVVLLLAGRVVALARIFYDTPLSSPRAGVRVNHDAAFALDPLLEALRAAPDPTAPVAALPYVPAINFLADRPLASRFFALLPLEEFADRQEQMIADLSRDPRTVTVYSLQHLASIPRPQEYAPRFFDHLVRNYRLGQTYNGTRMDGWVFSVLEPEAQVEETVQFDFAAHLDAAVLKVTTDSGGTSPSAAPAAGHPSLQVWPFEAPVVSVRPSIQPAQTTLSYSVDVQQPARLRFGVAMNPDEWTRFLTSELRYRIRVDGETAFEARFDPSRNFADRRWEHADIAIQAGHREIVFEVSTDNEYGVVDNLAGFARPRLVADDHS